MAECAACHTPAGWHLIAEDAAFDHAQTGFALVGLHADVACSGCHGQGLRAADETATACVRCHEDRHQASLGRDCERCHAPTGWRIPTAVRDHRSTRFPLAGAHIAADCTACHPRAREGTFAGVPTHCFACHADDYRRQDVHPDHAAAGFSTSCDACHTQYTWAMPRLRHELFFPLLGAHRTAACTDCHQDDRFGGTPVACVGCHKGDYDAAASPPHAATGMSLDCARCHTETAWAALRVSWHDAAFPIRSGPHSRFSCEACHLQPSYASFTCVTCHRQANTTAEHREVGGYVYSDSACYSCHPQGRER
jgi:hypothetical protein